MNINVIIGRKELRQPTTQFLQRLEFLIIARLAYLKKNTDKREERQDTYNRFNKNLQIGF